MDEFVTGLATLDIVILIVVLLSACIGLYRGLVKEVLSLLSWVAAFVLALYFSASLAEHIPQNWGGHSLRMVMAFAGVFIVTLVAASLLQWLVARLVAGTGLSGTDRFLGFLFGSARGLLVCVVILMGVREVAHETSWWRASVLQSELLAFEDEVRDMVGGARDMAEQMPVTEKLLPSTSN